MSPEFLTSILDFNQTYARLDASKPLDTGVLDELNFLMHSVRETSQTEDFDQQAQDAIIPLLKHYLTHVPIEKSDVLIFCDFVAHILTPDSFDNTAWKTNIDAIVSSLSTVLVGNLNHSSNMSVISKGLHNINTESPPITHEQFTTIISAYKTILPLSPVMRLYNFLFFTNDLSSKNHILISAQKNMLNVLLNEPIDSFLTKEIDNLSLLLRSNISWLEQRSNPYIDTYYFLLLVQLYASLQTQNQTEYNKIQNRLLSVNRKFTPRKAHFDILDQVIKALPSIDVANTAVAYSKYMTMLENLQEKMQCFDIEKYAQQLKLIELFSKIIPTESYQNKVIDIYNKMIKDTRVTFNPNKAFALKISATAIIAMEYEQILQLATMPQDLTHDIIRQQIRERNIKIEHIKKHLKLQFDKEKKMVSANVEKASFWQHELTEFYNEVNERANATQAMINTRRQQIPMTQTSQYRLFPKSNSGTATAFLKTKLQHAIKMCTPNNETLKISCGKNNNVLYFLIKGSPTTIEQLKTSMRDDDVIRANKKLNVENPGMLLLTQRQALKLIRQVKENIETTKGSEICQKNLGCSPQQSRRM